MGTVLCPLLFYSAIFVAGKLHRLPVSDTRKYDVSSQHRNHKEFGSITPPNSSPPMCQHERVRLTYPLDGPWNVRLPALRIASIVSSTVNNLVVLYALRCSSLAAAITNAVAFASSGAFESAAPSYSPKQK